MTTYLLIELTELGEDFFFTLTHILDYYVYDIKETNINFYIICSLKVLYMSAVPTVISQNAFTYGNIQKMQKETNTS